MRRKLSLLVSGALCAGLFAVFGAQPASGDVGCPNDMTPAPREFVQEGEKKDKNGNGVVCVKPVECALAGDGCHGGPDDDVERFGLPLLGNDGSWYFVGDDEI
jgi:hypothetical protein